MPSGDGSFFAILLGSSSNGTLTGVTTGTSRPFFAQPYQNLTFYVQAIGNPGVGTLVLEEAGFGADAQTYTGTWSPIQTIDCSTLVTSAQLAVHVTGSCCMWVRARFSVDMTVATGVVMVVGN